MAITSTVIVQSEKSLNRVASKIITLEPGVAVNTLDRLPVHTVEALAGEATTKPVGRLSVKSR